MCRVDSRKCLLKWTHNENDLEIEARKMCDLNVIECLRIFLDCSSLIPRCRWWWLVSCGRDTPFLFKISMSAQYTHQLRTYISNILNFVLVFLWKCTSERSIFAVHHSWPPIGIWSISQYFDENVHHYKSISHLPNEPNLNGHYFWTWMFRKWLWSIIPAYRLQSRPAVTVNHSFV